MKKVFLFLFFFFITFLNVYADDLVMVKIDRNNYDEFSLDKTDYQLNDVASDKKSIEVDIITSGIYQTTDSDKFKVISLKYGENSFSFNINNTETNEVKTYTFKVNRIDNRKKDNNLTSLTVGSNKIVLSDANEYNVSVDGKTESVEIHAGLPDGASFVDGYGERIGNNSVKLINQTTSVPIKVKAENESVREYKVNINKVNVLSNDATLKSLKIEGIDFEFKSDKFEYDLSVKNNVSNIKIEAVKNHEKSNVEYNPNVTLITGSNNIEIKVTAEDGTIKVYKLNITREEEVPIVKDIKIIGIDFEFKPKTYNYKIETSLSKLDFNITLSNPTATSEIIDNENLTNGSIVKIEAKDGEDTVTYTFRIINKEEIIKDESLDIAMPTTGNTTNSNNNFLKQYEMIIGLIIFGIGTMAALIAVLLKRKSKVM